MRHSALKRLIISHEGIKKTYYLGAFNRNRPTWVFLPKGTDRTNSDWKALATVVWKLATAGFSGYLIVSYFLRVFENLRTRHEKRHNKQASHIVHLVILPTNQSDSGIFASSLHRTNNTISQLIFLE